MHVRSFWWFFVCVSCGSWSYTTEFRGICFVHPSWTRQQEYRHNTTDLGEFSGHGQLAFSHTLCTWHSMGSLSHVRWQKHSPGLLLTMHLGKADLNSEYGPSEHWWVNFRKQYPNLTLRTTD